MWRKALIHRKFLPESAGIPDLQQEIVRVFEDGLLRRGAGPEAVP